MSDYKKDKVPVFISKSSRNDLKEIVAEYQKEITLRVTQQYALERLITNELKRIKKEGK